MSCALQSLPQLSLRRLQMIPNGTLPTGSKMPGDGSGAAVRPASPLAKLILTEWSGPFVTFVSVSVRFGPTTHVPT